MGSKFKAPPETHALNPKQVAFVAAYLNPKSPTFGNATTSYIAAGYSKKGADRGAFSLLRNIEIQKALSAWKDSTARPAIASIEERKMILTEIARAKVTDFGTAGADGFVINAGPESLNSRGIEAIKTRTEMSGEGGSGKDRAVISELKIRNPVPAIDILNKMDGVYVEKRELTGPDGGPISVAVFEFADTTEKD
jgi:phage terminase small subunit